jgi:hypothetical protein
MTVMRNPFAATIGFGLALAGCIMAVTLAVGFWQFTAVKRETISRTLDTAISVGIYVNEQRARQLEQISRDLAANTDFTGWIIQSVDAGSAITETRDVTAIRSALDQRRRDAALDAIALLDAKGKLVAEVGDTFLGEHVLGSLPVVTRSRAELVQASVTLDDDARLPVVTVTPIKRDADLKALLVTGLRMPADLSKAISGAAGVDVALIAIEPTGPTVVDSTLTQSGSEQLAATIEQDRKRWTNAAPSNFEISIDAQAWPARAAPLQAGGRKAFLVALVPPAQIQALLHAVAPALIVAMFSALVLLVTLVAAFWRNGVAPLTDIANLSERATHGDFALEVKPQGFVLIRRLGTLLNFLLRELDRYRVPHGVPRRRSTDNH